MNIITRIKNNLEYARYRKRRDKALEEMQKHIHDVDDTEFRYWTGVSIICIDKCITIPLH